MRSLPTALTTATAALAAALLLTACDAGGSDAKGTDSSTGSAASSGTGTDKAAGSACSVDGLGVEVASGTAPAAGDTGTVTVTLTNHGAPCTLDGFPKVDLVAGSTSAAVPADPAAKAQRLTLAKDGSTAFTITYVRGEEGGSKSLAVRTARFQLPGGTGTHDLSWSYGAVALKGGAGEPDASVSSFQPAGD
ncbi:DUF4232 domain-containing protein [Streptomyces sp. NPDC052682]|uniref:DUF4232 domain-containing protein n=1 Tax=Streptomyces sp. NPDC052682 TaxID=3154954 RepID=UPI00342E84F3